MQVLRCSYIRSIVIYLTGITFLNLSFLQVEVTLLKQSHNIALIENISLLLSEEEREAGASEDSHANAKEVDFILHQSMLHHTAFFELAESIKWLSNEGLFCHGFFKKFSPPPEV